MAAAQLTITDAALHILHILPTLTRLNGKEVTSSSKVFSSNMHGDDYFATRQIRTRYFPSLHNACMLLKWILDADVAQPFQ